MELQTSNAWSGSSGIVRISDGDVTEKLTQILKWFFDSDLGSQNFVLRKILCYIWMCIIALLTEHKNKKIFSSVYLKKRKENHKTMSS